MGEKVVVNEYWVNSANREWTGADYQVKLPSGEWVLCPDACSYAEAREHAVAYFSRYPEGQKFIPGYRYSAYKTVAQDESLV